MIKIYTDGSFKDGVSTHHYYAMRNGRRIKRRTFIGIDEDNYKAEATTIIKALQMVMKKGWDNVTVYTDQLDVVLNVNRGNLKKEDYRYISHLLSVTSSKIKYRNRNTCGIKKADSECRKMMKTKLRRMV